MNVTETGVTGSFFIPVFLTSELRTVLTSAWASNTIFILHTPFSIETDKSRAQCEIVLSLLGVRELLDQASRNLSEPFVNVSEEN